MKAKFIYTALLGLLFLSTSIYSQHPIELALGVEGGINISASEDDTPNGGTTTNTDISTLINGTDFSLLFGAGIEFNLNKRTDLFAQLGYELGLTNILKNVTTRTLKNTGLQITAGAVFDL